MRTRTPRERGWPQRVALVLASGALAACLAACTGAVPQAARPSAEASRSASAPAPTPVVEVPVQSSELKPPVASVPPTRLRIDSLGIDMSVTDVGVQPSGQMEIPIDPSIAGWYRYGPDATTPEGSMVMAAHVDTRGYPIGPLSRLRDIGAGSVISVDSADGVPRSYVVESLTFYDKTVLPIADLFARVGPPTLVLITCGGPYDREAGHYRDNVVAIARQQ